MKKVLLVPEFSSFGGTRNHFLKLMEFYSRQQYDVVVVLSNKQYDTEIKNLIKQFDYKHYIIRERRKGMLRFLDFFPFNILSDIFTILPIYLKEKPNLIAISNGTPGMFMGLMLFPVSFLYTFHTYPLKSKSTILTIGQKVFLNLFLKNNKKFIAVSEYSKSQILSYWAPERKSDSIHVIYNSARRLTIESNIHNEDVYRVLTIGHVIWYKNPKLWIKVSQKVIEQRPNKHLQFVWAGDGDLFEECKELVCNMDLEDSIKFIGYQEDVASLYDEATIYFQPSILESHGISVVEAMAHGLPCITSNAGGLPESVINNETGFTCLPDGVDCFVSQIIKLLDDADLREIMVKNGKVRVETIFSEEIQEKKMINLYTSLMEDEI